MSKTLYGYDRYYNGIFLYYLLPGMVRRLVNPVLELDFTSTPRPNNTNIPDLVVTNDIFIEDIIIIK